MNISRSTAKLLKEKPLLILAIDRPQIGLTPGLEHPYELLDSLSDSALDGFILNVGLAKHMQREQFLNKKLILRTSINNSMLSSKMGDYHKNFVHPKTVLQLGADAVLAMLVIGDGDALGIQHLAEAIDHYHQYGISVIVEILAADFPKTETFEVQANGARIAAEIGADAVKVFNCDGFENLVDQCPVPVIMAGGAKSSSISETIEKALKDGVCGFALGRNIFQSDNPAQTVQEIATILNNH